MNRPTFCIIRLMYFEFITGTELASIGQPPFIMPIMYSLHSTDVLEFESFYDACKYTNKMNEICGEENRYKIVPTKVGVEYAKQIVDRYRECRHRKHAARMCGVNSTAGVARQGNVIVFKKKHREVQ